MKKSDVIDFDQSFVSKEARVPSNGAEGLRSSQRGNR